MQSKLEAALAALLPSRLEHLVSIPRMGLCLWYFLANALGIGVGFGVNYLFENVFTWRTHANT